MTSQLIGLGSSNCLSSLVRAKVECCKSCDHCSYWVMDGSATRTPSSSLTGHHPQLTGGCIIIVSQWTWMGAHEEFDQLFSCTFHFRCDNGRSNYWDFGITLNWTSKQPKLFKEFKKWKIINCDALKRKLKAKYTIRPQKLLF